MNQSPFESCVEHWKMVKSFRRSLCHLGRYVHAVNTFLFERFCIIITLHFVTNLPTFCFSILETSFFMQETLCRDTQLIDYCLLF